MSSDRDDDPTTIRVDQFLAHPPAKVWRALAEPELIAQWLMPGAFRLEVGHRYTMRTLPRPGTNFSGTVEAEVLAFERERMLRIRWVDRQSAGENARAAGQNAGQNAADWTITWTLEPEGRGTRLFLVHEGFDPDDPAQMRARKIMGGGWRGRVMVALEEVLGESGPGL
ncbi:SRPBCC domain-containing protein [Streptomyces sp. NBC_01619]|uniref:SRPBCC family protein n=1 Tax=Streptomyces sp. NBC_01619 TaxID=2975901 RepID=UPI00225BB762|nr:SRPBCC domain-containing protein [Streptomyces sp. NBC_01619]MCX4512371.1 SRPBCC domain-containing protein [Streptomyces sp. NBC_01619]